MKIHRGTSEAVVQALVEIFEEKRYADRVVEKVLKQDPRWGSRDRRFIAETTYDIVRWYRWYRALAEAEENDWWLLLGVWCVLHEVAVPAWPEFSRLGVERVQQRYQSGSFERRIRASIPDWMDALGVSELGEEVWTREVHAFNESASVVLRVNTLKVTRAALQDRLRRENVETRVLAEFPEALVLETRQHVSSTAAFREGLFEVQDAGSQRIAPFLQAGPRMRVIDACAGAGGKTLHLAAQMHNKGRLIAMDTESWKLAELQKRARRAGVTNIETRVIESSKTVKDLAGAADRLLLDVPCSGMGVLKRNPDAKWKLSPGFIEEIRSLQQQILQDYSQMVKPGGLMVYATCSVLPSENEQQVERFITMHPAFTRMEEQHILPSAGFDGFYMALLRRSE